MSRATTGAFDTAVAAGHLEYVTFAELQFASGTVRVCTREQNIVWNGETWLGGGRVGSIEPIAEGVELEARTIAISLRGVQPEDLAIALNPTVYKNRLVRLWAGLFDTSSPGAITVVADPVGPFTYRMDSLDFELGEQGTLRLTAHSRLEDWRRPRIRRYNDADHRLEHPDDKFFEFTEQMVNKTFVW